MKPSFTAFEIMLVAIVAALSFLEFRGDELATSPPPVDAALIAQQAVADTPCPPPTALQCLGVLMNKGYAIMPLGADIQRWTWTPPTTGNDVATYWVDVQFKMMSSNPAMEFAIIGPADSVMVRVQGQDGAWHKGPWSEWGGP